MKNTNAAVTCRGVMQMNISDHELKLIIRKNPDSLFARAYRLGRKEANIELQGEILKIQRERVNAE